MTPEKGEYWRTIKTGVVIEVAESRHTVENLYVKAFYELIPSHFIEIEINLPPLLFDCYFRKLINLPCISCGNNTFNLLKQEHKQTSKDIVDAFGSIIEDGRRVFSHLQCRNCKEEFIRFDTQNKAEMSVVNPAELSQESSEPPKGTFVIPTSFPKNEAPNLSSLFDGPSSINCPSCSDSETKYPMNNVTAKGITIYTCGVCGHSEERNEQTNSS